MIIHRIDAVPENPVKRVAAYIRVSTDQENQEESYETQYAVYKEMIENTPDWVMAGIYADKRSGTNIRHRPGFQRLMIDAEAGKIDIILVKSVSRFSRNLGDCQRSVDILRAQGVTVIFEENNIRTDEPTSNFALALTSAISQDESHSIGQNMRWSYQQRFANGEFNLGNNRILGYDSDKDGKLKPNKDAWIVLEAFERFAAGESYRAIANALNDKGARSLRGKPLTGEAIRYFMINETYVGDKHLQKQHPTDYVTHRPDINVEYKDYYLTDDHEGIVSRALWDQVQALLKKRKDRHSTGIITSGEHHFLYGKVFCGECGAPFVRRTIRAKQGSHYKAWNCRERQKGKKENGCKCRFVKEDQLVDEIKTSLGWDTLDEGRFVREVSRVKVRNGGIDLEKHR